MILKQFSVLTTAADITAGGAHPVPVICDVAGGRGLRHREGWAAVWCCNSKHIILEIFCNIL